MGIASYSRAQKAGQKEYKTLAAQGADPYICALENILPPGAIVGEEPLGLMSIPMERIAGTRTKARRDCFSASFLPLLEENTEFATKWAALVDAHLAEGIRDPITAVEYMNRYYVVEGNKRVSVLRYFDSPSVTGTVVRLIPAPANTLEYQVYQEYLAFYKATKINYIQFQRLGKYKELLNLLNDEDRRSWDFERQREFFADCTRFRRAYQQVLSESELDRDEALLRYLKIYGYDHLSTRTPAQLEQDLKAVEAEMHAGLNRPDPNLHMEPDQIQNQSGFSWRFWDSKPKGIKIAFLHDKSDETSWWTEAHERGRRYAQEQFGSQIETVSFFNMLGCADEQIDQLAQDGYKLIFTTTPRLNRPTLKIAVKYPKIRFFNCSVNIPFSSVRTYYCRIFEGKFITGAIAGAMANNDRIGYIGSYPIFGVPASINAFALGAQLTNPRARIDLRWSCVGGDPVKDFMDAGYQVISNRDVPTPFLNYQEFGEYGTYFVEEDRTLTPLASPCWLWGTFYERVIRAILGGTWEQNKEAVPKAMNYWWGMDSGVIDIELSPALPESMKHLANVLRTGLRAGNIDPFARQIISQDGRVMNGGVHVFTPDELLHMDWLCENVEGHIPEFEEVLPFARNMVRQLGVHRERIPREKEADAL